MKTKILKLVMLALFVVGLSSGVVMAQSPDLLISAGGAGGSDYGYSVATDASGNIYKTGNFSGMAVFGSTILVSAGGSDIFIAKYNSAGVLQWAKRAGGTVDDCGYGIALSGTSVYVTGYFNGTANFNTPSATGSNEITSAGGADIFVAKFDDAGTFQWVKRAGGTGYDYGNGIAISGASVYVTGYFNGTADFNTPTDGGSNTIVSAVSSDIFVAKFDDAGNFQWAKRAGETGVDYGYGIAVSGTSVYVTGTFDFTANFNTPSATGSNEIVSAGDFDIFVAKFDDTGTFQWAKRAGGTGADEGKGIFVSGASVYVTGYFNGTANFNTPSTAGSNEITSAGWSDIFVTKFDDEGTFQWAKRAGGISLDEGTAVFVSGASVYVTGYFNGTANFNTPSTAGSNEIVSSGSKDIFVAKFNDTGTKACRWNRGRYWWLWHCCIRCVSVCYRIF